MFHLKSVIILQTTLNSLFHLVSQFPRLDVLYQLQLQALFKISQFSLPEVLLRRFHILVPKHVDCSSTVVKVLCYNSKVKWLDIMIQLHL